MRYLFLAVGLVIVIMLIMRVSKRSGMIQNTVQRIVNAQGAMRCVLATQLFQQLAQAGNNTNIVELWEKVEMPLLQAIPDCPPDQKTPLANAITDAAKHVTNREVAKRMMTMRNGILADL